MKKTLWQRIITRLILELFKIVLPILDFLFPKDKQKIIFSLKFGRYSDNSKYLYEYMILNTNYNPIWLAENKIVKENILEKFPKANVCLRYSIRGLIHSLNAKYYIFSYSILDNWYFSFFSNRTIKIMLWHAITLKKYGTLDKKSTSKIISKYLKETKKYDLAIASSLADSCTTSLCQGINYQKVSITGLPRNDIFYNSIKIVKEKRYENILNKKIILYAPTFRDFGTTMFFPFESFDFKILNQLLISSDAYLLLRPHQNDFKNQVAIEKLSNSFGDRFILANNTFIEDLQILLPFVNIVITDYSSIYIDLLLKDVAPIFIAYDLDEYEKVRGLAYDYELVTPGPKVSTQQEFIDAIKDALNGAEQYKEQRKFVKKMFHKYDDGQACKRIVEAMEKLV
jgi:CDP-glycerol glycerophosphotransferase (TagB/SpsB family)